MSKPNLCCNEVNYNEVDVNMYKQVIHIMTICIVSQVISSSAMLFIHTNNLYEHVNIMRNASIHVIGDLPT